MKHNRISINLLTDISYIAFILLLFATVSFIAIDSNFINVNIVILSVASMIMILTYFTSLLVGVAASALIIFSGIVAMLYLGLEKGFPVPNLLYFWCVMLPAYVVCIGYLSKNTSKLQKKVIELDKNIADLVTIDDLTGLKNQKQFINDTDAYMSIAKRYDLKLALMVVELRYQDDIERIVGKQNMDEIAIHLAQALSQSVRREDLAYIIDTQHFSFAVLMITNDYDGIKIAVDRTKKKVSAINMGEIARFANVDLNMRIGYSTLEQDYETSLDFLNAAKHELEFDV